MDVTKKLFFILLMVGFVLILGCTYIPPTYNVSTNETVPTQNQTVDNTTNDQNPTVSNTTTTVLCPTTLGAITPIYASVEIYDASNLVATDTIQEGTTTSYGSLAVAVVQISEGYSFGAKWAKLIITTPDGCVSDVVNTGQSLSSGNYEVKLIDLTEPYPQSSCAVLSNYKLCSDAPLNIGGTVVSLVKASPGYLYQSRWVQLNVGGVQNLSNVGDTITIADQQLTLTDITIPFTSQSRASFSVLDSFNTLQKESVGVGSSFTSSVYTITVLEVAPGSYFNAKWAKVKINDGVTDTTEILSIGETASLGANWFILDDLTIANPQSSRAILSLLDGNGNILSYEAVKEGSSIYLPSLDQTLLVTKVSPGYSFGSKWATVAVGSYGDTLNIGESLNLGNYSLRLDDLSVAYPETARAIVEFDTNNVTSAVATISEGASTVFANKLITVKTLAQGYSSGLGWVKITIDNNDFVIKKGESLALDNNNAIKLTDITVANPSNSHASLKISNANTVYYTSLKEGAIDSVTGITVTEVAPGYTFGAKWAKLQLGSDLATLNSGDSVLYNGYNITLEDLTVSYK